MECVRGTVTNLMSSHWFVLLVTLFLAFLSSGDCLQCACGQPSKSCKPNDNGAGHSEVCPVTPDLEYACFYEARATVNRTWVLTQLGCRAVAGRGTVRRYSLTCEQHDDPLKPGFYWGCCRENNCNRPSLVIPSLPPVPLQATEPPITTEYDVPTTSRSKKMETGVAIAAAVLGVIICIIVLVTLVELRKRARRRQRMIPNNLSELKMSAFHPLSKKPGLFLSEADSGFGDGDSSGRGVLQLEERTISREITLSSRIGTGRFGEVYRGIWRDTEVAVKIFRTMDEASFFREVDLFNTNMLRHENIVGFRAADNRDCSLETQLWMVLDYHSNGSLFDYLRSHAGPCGVGHKPLKMEGIFKLAASTAAGLAHLHFRIGGTNGFQSFGHKPSIAHRDLKTKNILVKADGTCCIADFGMAVRDDPGCGDLKSITHANLKAGTRRYMAPEILDGSINIENFESFRQVDMYAFSIVLWEIMSCCSLPGYKEPMYQFPYEHHVAGDPTVEDMLKVVCVGGYRPEIPRHWQDFSELKDVTQILSSCWRAKPAGRYTAPNVSKKLHALLNGLASKPEVKAVATQQMVNSSKDGVVN